MKTLLIALLLAVPIVAHAQYTPSGPVFPVSGCGSLPVSDNFSGSGALSPCWTSTTATGNTFVPIIQSGGSAVATGGGLGLAIYTGVSFPSNFYSQGALTYSGGGFSGIALSTVSGNGYLYIASNNDIVGLTNGAASGTIVSGCTALTSGHLVRLSWNNSTTILTVIDETSSTTLCTSGPVSNIPGMLPAIWLDGPTATDKFNTFTAD